MSEPEDANDEAQEPQGSEVQESAKQDVSVNEKEASVKSSEQPREQPVQGEVPILVVPWFRQLKFVMRKNYLLIVRRPFYLTAMLLSSVASVLIAWIVVKDDDDKIPFVDVPLYQCGDVDYEWYSNLAIEDDPTKWDSSKLNSVPLSNNDQWRDGLGVSLMAMGPMVLGVSVFLLVQPEIETKMLGVLRALGMRESVFWISWWVPFLVIATINALLGSVTAIFIENVYAFQHISFGPIFVSLFFLNVGLIGASFFLVALGGGTRAASAIFVMIMVVATFVPYIVIGTESSIPDTVDTVNYAWDSSAMGLFWVNRNTSQADHNCRKDYNTSLYTCNVTSCEVPLVSADYAYNLKTNSERYEDIEPEDYFLGCYFGAGISSELYTDWSGYANFVMAAIPYTQFVFMWANFLGYTGMPDRNFGLGEMSMSAETLANQTVGPLDPNNAQGSGLFSQGTTSAIQYVSSVWDSSVSSTLYSCPGGNVTEEFCNNLYSCHAAIATESVTPNGMILILLAFALLYTLMGAYWIQVFPAGNGARQPYYFPFLWRYWFADAWPKRADVSFGETGVQAEAVSKVYGEVHAVDNVDMSMAVGEVTALLGHNGAGKTTLSHVLCCETLPSEGDASVFGLSVTKEKNIVRQLVGVCKQDDYLYPNLSAREHIELFAGLRGVKDEDMPSVVQEWLESVDLALVQDQYSSGFSGGMKRRLSVACSTVGESLFVVLDEPTTGMDPVSRRFIWKHVDHIKHGRVVLLTTHAMEEADLLADTVFIMRKGRVAASGSPLQLKAEYGSSLQFNLLVDADDMARTVSLIKERFHGAEEWVDITEAGSGNITVSIAKVREDGGSDGVEVETLADFASFLDSGASGVQEYGFSNSSLEEVFLKVTEGDKEDAEGEEDSKEKETDAAENDADENDADENDESLEAEKEEKDEDSEDLEIDDGAISGIGAFEPQLTLRGQFVALIKFMLLRDWTGHSSIGNWIVHSVLLCTVVFTAINAANSSEITFFVLPVFTVSISIMSVVTPIYYERYTGLFYLTRSQGLLKKSYVGSQAVYAFGLALCFTLLTLSLMYATPLFRESTVCTGSGNVTVPCGWSYGDPHQEVIWDVRVSWYSDEYEGENIRLVARRTPGGYGLILGIVAGFALTMPGSVFSGSYLPGFKLAVTVVTIMVLIATGLPLVIYMVFDGRGGEEKDECRWDICNSTYHGNETSYDGVDFLNCLGRTVTETRGDLGALCVPTIAGLLPQGGVFHGLSMVLMDKMTLTTDPPTDYVEKVLIPRLSGDVNCDDNICQFPYARELYGGYVGFMVLGGVILAIIGFGVLSLFSYPGKRALSFRASFCRFIDNIFGCSCLFKTADQQAGDQIEVSSEVTEEQTYVRSIVEPFVSSSNSGEEEGEGGKTEVSIPDYDAIPREEIPPVLAFKLRKEYPLGGLAKKVALNSLELHVPKGQVLGLLGKNGAGKTTALKIFAGAHDSSSGIALVAGYDVSCEQLHVFERLGNCAQFDSVWPHETVQTHLEFFGGLKGLPKDQLKEIARAVASSVGLGVQEVYTRKAGALSGGMRRRLSIAISLIGAPSVLLLDEPTTGLDPSTRNTIWELIGSFATEKRAIVITTHMMLEADTLCNRIAIMAKGNLKTIGTQQWLKDHYGSGFLLQLNLTSSDKDTQDRAMEFVRERLHPGAILQTRQAKTLQVALPRDVSLGDVFRVLYSSDRFEAGCINQFLFSQSSLEDVFIALGE